jgi:hypothetical protein
MTNIAKGECRGKRKLALLNRILYSTNIDKVFQI